MDELAHSRNHPAAVAEHRITAMRGPGRPVPRLLASGVAGTLVAASLLVAPAPATAAPVHPTAARAAHAAGRGFTPVHPLAAGDPHAAGHGFAPATASYNPATGNQGFGVFVQGNAALGATSTTGPVAMGGNLTVGSNFTVASQTAGTYTASGDSVPTGLLVGGSINWAGSNSGGAVNVGSSAYVKVANMKVGDTTGSIIPNNGNNPTHIVPYRGQLRVKAAGRTFGRSAANLSEPADRHQLRQRVQRIRQSVHRHGELCQFAGAHELKRDGADLAVFLQHERLRHAYPRQAECP